MRGRLTRAERLKVAYFAQHQLDELDPAASAYLHLRRRCRMPPSRVRARAGAIGFRARWPTPRSASSRWRKSRLLLGLATFEGAHLLILDEPTNHLDIDSRAALIEAINGYRAP
jgi:ATP-binding cassette subfamily F protein 3